MNIKNISIVFLFLMLLFSACKKEAGLGGKKTISGTVTYKNGATGAFEIANTATVHIEYGTTTYNSAYDQSVAAGMDGTYHFDGLRKGDYFISAEFIDVHGFKYVTGGYSVTVNNKKEKLTVNIELQ